MLLAATTAHACVPEAPRHNSYLFSVFNRSLMGDRFTDATEKFWQRYVGNADMPSYRWGGREEVMNKAKKRKDVEMQTYCRRLNSYLDNCVNFNAWDYPTKQQLANRAATLNNLLRASKAYRGKRLRAQYDLMRMRALLGLKRYQEGVNFWNATGKRMQPSVYRDMARNIYAGCLWRTGKKSQAIEVYAEQEDYQSLKYCVRGYRNLAGIQKVYAANPNSATLAYLVQDFVNNVQETMDVYGARHMPFATGNETKADLDEWMKEIDAKNITTAEANRFISFARGVVAEGKTGVPCLWQAAIGCVEHQMGLYDKAKADLAKAMSLAGTQRMKDNARAIYAANSIFAATRRDESFDKWLAGEMKWLDMKSAEDRKSTTLYDTDHYRDVQERMVYNGLVPMCAKEGRASAALVLLSGMNDGDPRWYYQGTYFDALNNATTDDLKAYVKYLAKQPSDSLESWAWRRAYREPDFYNDIIGTRLLAQARFADAVPFLEKVSVAFLNNQNIAPYAAQRSYAKERWMGKQAVAQPEYLTEEQRAVLPKLQENKKLSYCRDMLNLLSQYSLMKPSEERMRKAYELASMWYQGSWEGDCWWLTQYGVSVMQDSVMAGTADFVAKAMSLLDESAQSTDFKLKEKSLYALAFIRHGEPWFFEGWDDATQQYYDISNLKPLPQSRQYKALAALSSFCYANAGKTDLFVSRCDVLRRFRDACQIQRR